MSRRLTFFVVTDSFAAGSAHGSRIGGKSGGVRNDELVKELKEVALEHVRKRIIPTRTIVSEGF